MLGRPHDGSVWKEEEMRGPGHLRLEKAASGEDLRHLHMG
jgi:hypothetical protein